MEEVYEKKGVVGRGEEELKVEEAKAERENGEKMAERSL